MVSVHRNQWKLMAQIPHASVRVWWKGSKWINLFFQTASWSKVHQWISCSPLPSIYSFPYGPLHTPFSTVIENKPRFCSKPSFMCREDQILWNQTRKATSSGRFLIQLLESSILFSLASQTRFVVRLDLVYSVWIQSWKRCPMCQHSTGYIMTLTQTQLLALQQF